MEKYKVSTIDDLSPELINSLIERFKLKELKRLQRLQEYYNANTDIKQRTMSDESKPNNMISTSYPQYLTNTINAFFLGKPVSYISSVDELMDRVQPILDDNHEQTLNSRIGKSISITGVGYELAYVDEQTQLKFVYLDPTEAFMIYDNTIQSNPIAAVRFFEVEDYLTNENQLFVELYTKDYVQSFKQDKEGLVKVAEPQVHYLKEVPVNVYFNNDEATGDYEKVIDLINAYELSISDQANSYAYFSDAYLMVTGAELDETDFDNLKEQRLMVLPQGASADFLVKQTDYLSMREYQERLKNDIHALSFTPDLQSETFGNASGESLKYKLFGLESYVSIKEAMMRHSLENRLKIIVNYLNIKGGSFNSSEITMNFTRNLPPHLESIAALIKQLDGIVSRSTLLQLLPFIQDVNFEKELLEMEKQGIEYTNFSE